MKLERALLALPPSRWRVAADREQVVSEYLQLGSPTLADTDSYAARLGIKRRAFYLLAARAREGAAVIRRRRSTSLLSPEQDIEIANAMQDLPAEIDF